MSNVSDSQGATPSVEASALPGLRTSGRGRRSIRRRNRDRPSPSRTSSRCRDRTSSAAKGDIRACGGEELCQRGCSCLVRDLARTTRVRVTTNMARWQYDHRACACRWIQRQRTLTDPCKSASHSEFMGPARDAGSKRDRLDRGDHGDRVTSHAPPRTRLSEEDR